jgi:hypothetical protein
LVETDHLPELWGRQAGVLSFFRGSGKNRVVFRTRIPIAEIAPCRSVPLQLENNPLQELAGRVRHGEPGAAEAFRRVMSLALEGMVRLALRKRACFSPFEDQARAEADRLQDQSDGQLTRNELVRETASRVCQAMIGRLQAGRAQDTVAGVGAGPGSRSHQTVVSRAWSGAGCQWPPVTGC